MTEGEGQRKGEGWNAAVASNLLWGFKVKVNLVEQD